MSVNKARMNNLRICSSGAQVLSTQNIDSASVQFDDIDKGFLPNRLTTTQRNAIVGPVLGLTIYNTTTSSIETYNGSTWVSGGGGGGGGGGGSGTVTSVTISSGTGITATGGPITTAGTISIALANPTIAASGGNVTGSINLAAGTFTLNSSGSGSVTSVGITPGSSKISSSGGPITTTGAITVDVVESNLTLGNLGGTLPVTKGGTGVATLASNGLLLGSGTSAITAVTAPVTASSSLIYNGTSIVWDADFYPPRTLYVDPYLGNDTFVGGSIRKPYKTIMAALAYAQSQGGGSGGGFAWEIHLSPGGYTEDIVIDGFQNLLIQGMGPIDSQPTRITGSITLTGATTTRCRFKDINMVSDTVTKVPFTVTGTSGRFYLENVTIARAGGSTAHAMDINGAFQRWIDLDYCSIDGIVSLDGTPSNGAALYFQGRAGGSCNVQINQNYNVNFYNVPAIGYITHSNGQLTITNTYGIIPDGSGNSIISTATNGTTTNALFLNNVNFQVFASGTSTAYGKINKTGNCVYYIGGCNRNSSADTLTGTRVNYANMANDITANHTAVNYTAAAVDVVSHIAGIDTALASRARLVGSAPANSSDTGTVGDYFVDGSFAYFCIATNSWVRTIATTF